MPTIDELKAELEDVTTMKFIASAFTEVAASRIQKIKNAFENNKQFYDEISYLYHLVQVSSAKTKAGSKTGGREGRNLTVAITSNQRFYGNLNLNIMQSFLTETKGSDADLMVVGVTGCDYMDSAAGEGRKYARRTFAKDNPTPEETSKFLDDIKDYHTVLMYYPKFVTLMTQTVGKTDVTQAADIGGKVPEDEIYILFEPGLTQILEFFKRHLRAILFVRVMLESDLSRTAARLLTMSGAEERSNELTKVKKSQLRKIQLSIANAKLLETFAAISGWKKGD
jgi:ATP synthase F1 gamma subunit